MLYYRATLTMGLEKQSSVTLGNHPKYVRRDNKCIQELTDIQS